jgi:hypothetical protein
MKRGLNRSTSVKRLSLRPGGREIKILYGSFYVEDSLKGGNRANAKVQE